MHVNIMLAHRTMMVNAYSLQGQTFATNADGVTQVRQLRVA